MIAALLAALWLTVAAVPAHARRLIGDATPAPATTDDPVPPDTRIGGVRFVLGLRDRGRLEALIAAQQDPRAPDYRRWRDATELADRFGARRTRYERLRAWLVGQGLTVTRDSRLRLAITVAGTAAQFETALATRLRRLGADRVALDPPSLPDEVAGDVAAIVGLERVERYRPTVTLPDSSFALAPADFALAYDVGALHTRGLSGAGVTIAVVARSDYHDADVAAFRNAFLPGAGGRADKRFVGANPGILSGAGNIEEKEVLLDTQWAGAMAPGATVETVVGTRDGGVVESLEVSVEENRAALLSFSFALCEPSSSRGNSFLVDALYALANAQGQTVLVAAGDNGSSDCGSARTAVNVLASSPHAIAVGGTTLPLDVDGSGNAVARLGETVWNDAGGATGGGVSALFGVPRFQRVAGVGEFGARGLPDLAVAASPFTPGYAYVRSGQRQAIGGTSAATPAMAGALALAVEQQGRLGQALPAIYQIGSRQVTAQGTPVFRDVTSGSNGAFAAGPGFDLASGWGAPDVTALVDALATEPPARCSPRLDCLVPAVGPPATRCGVEWLLDVDQPARRAATASYPVGAPRPDQVCRDGDPACDRDGAVDGVCTVALGLCLNVNDPRTSSTGHAPRCRPSTVRSVRILQPRTGTPAAAVGELRSSLGTKSDLAESCAEPTLVALAVSARPHRFAARVGRAGGRSTAKLRIRCTS